MNKPKSKRWTILLLIALSGCAVISTSIFESRFGPERVRDRTISGLSANKVDYWTEIQPILDKRCAVCHGCYDAPCQLKLTSIEGLDRGASKHKVYDAARITPAETTRLYEDASNTEGWRNKNFFPVLNERIDSLAANRESSAMYQLLKLKEQFPLPDTQKMLDSFTFGIDRKESCPTSDEINNFAEEHPYWGMPYGLPGLPDYEQDTLLRWLEEGANYTPRVDATAIFESEIRKWEVFLNQESLKSKLVSRYIYEHLFLAHIYFDSGNKNSQPLFFKLVRSSTPPGHAIKQISTRRPYDDPQNENVFYRLAPEHESIVSKTHMPYKLDTARMQRWHSLFFERDYEITELPGYDTEVAANPFKSFQKIPIKSRYKFLLDEAQFTIMNFIKGPVCRGQVALNVIRDNFWVFFIDPDAVQEDLLESFIHNNINELELPIARENIYLPFTTWRDYAVKRKEYYKARREIISQVLETSESSALDYIWDGDKVNPNAALTIFRHFDSATVEQGLVGPPPETAWIIGYPLLERIHYLLVAGYDVYGNVGHQLFSRLYMDFLRMEGESTFLSLLPPEQREAQIKLWYRNSSDDVIELLATPDHNEFQNLLIAYSSDNPKAELYELIKAKLNQDLTNTFSIDRIENSNIRKQLHRLQRFKGKHVSSLPELSFIQIIQSDGTSVYASILKNVAHLNITSLFKEEENYVPEEFTITVTKGLIGSYPNALFKVEEKELPVFIENILIFNSADDYTQLHNKFGVARNDPAFWVFSDKLHSDQQKQKPITYGIYDYNRLEMKAHDSGP